MTRCLRLLHALDAHRAALTARLDALPEAVVHTRPAPDAWSLAQVAEHLLRIDGGLRLDGASPSPGTRATSRIRSTGIQAILALPLRIVGPPSAQYVMPSDTPRWPEVRERWAALRAEWMRGIGAADPGAVAFLHPIAGPFLLDDALAFLLAHHRHHGAQVRRTLREVEQVGRGAPVRRVEAPEPSYPVSPARPA